MTGLAWKFNRLRLMGAKEIGYRCRQWIGQQWEERRVKKGCVPAPARVVGPRIALLPRIDSWLVEWSSRFRIDSENLTLLAQGKIGFFGHPPIDVGAPIDWHRDPITGIRAPLSFGKGLNYRDDLLVGNVKFLWELGRHQHLVPLAAAYACAGDISYRDAVAKQIDSWIDDNPYGLGIHWCSALELALRLISWAMVHSLLALRDGEEGLFAAVGDRTRLGLSIYQQTRFVRNFLSRYSSANNHLIGELTGLWVATRAFDLGSEGERWGRQAQNELEREVRSQVYKDGVDKEQAFYYHLWVVEYLLVAWIVGERCSQPFSSGFKTTLRAMARFLNDVTPSGGEPPQIGDADDGFVTRFEPSWPKHPYGDVLIAVSAVLDADGISASRVLPEKAFWYALAAGKMPHEYLQGMADGQITPYPRIYREGGYAVLGDARLHVVFDAGSLGYPSIAAHGHADALSFCMAVDSQWWIVDPGTYAYHSDPARRDYFRGTSAHNTVMVDGRHQSQMGGAFLWLRHAHAQIDADGVDEQACQWVEGHHDGYKSVGLIHRRRIEFSSQRKRITITDQFDGSATHDFRIFFHFAPDISVLRMENGGWLVTKSGSNLRMVFEADEAFNWDVVRGSEQPLLGWYSSALGKKVPSTTLVGRCVASIPLRTVVGITLEEAAADALSTVDIPGSAYDF